jgi:hypothetical protein
MKAVGVTPLSRNPAAQASQAAANMSCFVILSGAKNLSSILSI